ncbi:exported hypothetical protein [Desulfamplus magnetovallimortis]|uniref:Uncharacterized protein n=1 Tax=Desulfamplus magnetovallimortis TaxID=1246637 RepID=A0A1W1HB96_9BACT|nr:hypothetical protein [Desulfamplus magnetovallimortis]SLM29757.1 exported hypothetical protein [Desulfamplus magnetovallimortis]
MRQFFCDEFLMWLAFCLLLVPFASPLLAFSDEPSPPFSSSSVQSAETLQESFHADGCQELKDMLENQNTKIVGELRRVKREIAALKAELDKPGLKEIFAGIGYILGFFGVAAFVAARNQKKSKEC